MKLYIIILLILILPSVSAAHYIVGQVNNAPDGTTANGRTVVVWNPVGGIADNVTDIVGQTGNSGTDNVYFVDCESLNTPCQIGDTINARIVAQGDIYLSEIVNLTVTGSGYDLMPDLNLTLEIYFTNISVDDTLSSPANEIDLTPAGTTNVMCNGIVQGKNMDSLLDNVTSEFFSSSSSLYGGSDQNYKHYSNSSCELNRTYGDQNQVYFNCTYAVQYYAINGNWNCTINATKSSTLTARSSVNTTINTLLAIALPDTIDYGTVDATSVSQEKVVNVTNYGNVAMNLSIRGYGASIGDNLSMNCTNGNITIGYQKYNLTASNPGNLNLQSFESHYLNLTSNLVVKNISLGARRNDLTNDAFTSTYWRIYAPTQIGGACSGKVIFGAVSAPGT